MGAARQLIWMRKRCHDRCSTSPAERGEKHWMGAAMAIHENGSGSPESLRQSARHSYRQKLGWNHRQ
jgi:hypothetical protein